MSLFSRVLPVLLPLVQVSFLAGVLAHSFGCSSAEINENAPEEMYKEAENDVESDRYQTALDRLRMLKTKYPYSKFSVLAQLKIADVYFLQESFPEAAAAYELFRDLHPKHEKVPYAMFRVAESYFMDIPDNLARDISSAYRAQDSFKEYVNRFPRDERSDEARKRISDVRAKLAEKELYIANFYYKNENWKSARSRYRKLLELYPEAPAAENAKVRIPLAEEMIVKQEALAKEAESKQ